MPKLPVQGLPDGFRHQLRHCLPDELVLERQPVWRRRKEVRGHRLIDHSQQGARRLAQYFRDILDPEGAPQQGCCLGELAGARGQSLEPVGREYLDPLGNPGGRQTGSSVGHGDGVLVEQPAEGFGEYEGVSRGADRELDERRIGGGAEHIADHRDLGLWVERPQHDHGGSLVFEQIEEQFRGAGVR